MKICGASGLHFLLHFPYAFSGHLVINTLERNGRKILFLLLLFSWTDIPPEKNITALKVRSTYRL